MKRALLIILLGALTLTTGCSKDDMANDGLTAEAATTEASTEILGKASVMCTDMKLLKLDCASAGVNAPITFSWNNTKLSYVFNRVYKSYIQIESNDCGSNHSTVNIPIHFFSTSHYTLPEGRNETCFKYRIVILGYDKGQLACESMSPWQLFDYTKQAVPLL